MKPADRKSIQKAVTMPTAKEREQFVRALLGWYEKHGSDLPWRNLSNPYLVLVSECMLQQTQVDRVIPKYHAFAEQFPDVASLARASTGDVLRAWSGLGYNSRALRLQKFAREVVENHGGIIPSDIATLLTLPGIGKYTAGAIRTFGYGLPAAFIDVNIARILHRVFFGAEGTYPALSTQETEELAAYLAPMTSEAYPYHQALMDVGRKFCTARKTTCADCPLKTQCRARMRFEAEPLYLAEHRKKNRRTKEPFALSQRFLRGRIIHLLREHHEGLDFAELHALLSAIPVPNLERLPKALLDLEKEELLHLRENRYML